MTTADPTVPPASDGLVGWAPLLLAIALLIPVFTAVPLTAGGSLAAAARTKPQRAMDVANAARDQAGLARLVLRDQLNVAAKLHANDMASRNRLSHVGTDGSNPGQRMWRAGYRWQTWGENIAAGYPSPETAMRAWLASPGHRANILNPALTQMGIAYTISANGTVYWTMDLGTRRS